MGPSSTLNLWCLWLEKGTHGENQYLPEIMDTMGAPPLILYHKYCRDIFGAHPLDL